MSDGEEPAAVTKELEPNDISGTPEEEFHEDEQIRAKFAAEPGGSWPTHSTGGVCAIFAEYTRGELVRTARQARRQFGSQPEEGYVWLGR